jgi:uncharacterized Zn finger protein (UPF0148 family)
MYSSFKSGIVSCPICKKEEKVKLLENLGLTSISENLGNNLEIECEKGHIFKRTFNTFKQGTTKCPHCEREERINFLNSLGFIPISKDLGNNLEVKCKKGHIIKKTFDNFKKGAIKCPLCEKEEKVKFLHNLGFIPVSEDLDKKLEVKCEKDHIFRRAFGNFKNGTINCPICEREEKINFLNSLGFTPISEKLSIDLEVRCEKGHTFKRAFDAFKDGFTSCPVCEKEEKIQLLNSLGFTPISESLGTDLKVKCEKGHIFKRKFSHFKDGITSCPVCGKEEKTKFLNSLGFIPISEDLSDYLEVKCEKGHTFKRTFSNFKNGTTNCPICEKEEKLEFLNSLGFTPVSEDLSINLEVKCEKSHIFKRPYANFKDGVVNCPICEREEKIILLGSLGFTPVSEDLSVNLEVKCEKGHIFNRVFGSFKDGITFCPICEKEEKLEFISSLGFTPISEDLSINLEVKCTKGHTFKRPYANFKQGIIKCPICEREEKLEFISSLGFTTISEDLSVDLEVKCKNGHTFKRAFSSFKNGTTKCPICFPSTSSAEIEIKEFLNSLNIEYVHSDWSIITPQELDFYIPSHNLAIEFNGIYWHSELQGKGKDYHLEKTQKCSEKGIKLLHIFENEWNSKKDIWKNIIKDNLELNERICSSKCNLKQVAKSEEKQFLENNHLQGYVDSQIAFGLYYEDELVTLMSFSKNKGSYDVKWELLRFASKQNVNVIDGASKILKYFRENFEGGIVVYSDRRYSIDSIYKELGFQFSHNSDPKYFYFKSSGILENSQKYMEHKLPSLLEKFDHNLTEWENMVNNGYNRIWDCGNSVWKIV